MLVIIAVICCFKKMPQFLNKDENIILFSNKIGAQHKAHSTIGDADKQEIRREQNGTHHCQTIQHKGI
jgi:flavorubredoxin